MKRDIFEDYVDRVSSRFDVPRERMFTKDKSRDVVDARHMLYYLCSERPMSNTYIKQYMGQNGYHIDLPSIGHGIKRVEHHISEDPDYITLINQLK
jgi:chromosomal replication initiation ATPase DnaA